MQNDAKGMHDKALTAKQQMFVQEYIIDFNGSRSVIAAGYSDKAANVMAAKLLAQPKIQAALANAMRQRAARLQITQDRVLLEVARLAMFDIRKMLHPDGSMKAIDELDDDTAASLIGLDVFEEFAGAGEERVQIGWTKKFKLADKKGALELLMRHMGMLNDKLKLQGDAANPLVLLLQQMGASGLKPVANPPVDED
ncbi:terminase small subunit [Paraburkholderia hospita]|uniref:terminase small subunit n=1 Tax=Paraburkholderia hospita TaxID=169430 RepID=UPI0008A755C6|nr:terminase small subunit [Paraburkholderia hospita]SEH89382.1 phage terminase small subunit [Paraburkholderia hospita]